MSKKKVNIGNITIGDKNIIIQSMLDTKTENIEDTLNQINELYKVGCQIVRVAVPSMEAAECLSEIVKKSPMPVVADLHFDEKIALKAIKSGVQKVRLNPGTLKNEEVFKHLVDECKKNKVAIRIGVNGGSLHKKYEELYENDRVSAMLFSIKEYVEIAEKMNFYNIVLSAKSSDVLETIEVNKKLSEIFDYPLHIGVTEAGSILKGSIKNSVGIGVLLFQGIGDTIRVSLTDSPIEEVKVAKEILSSLGLMQKDYEIISCPTCGRTQIDLKKIVNELEKKIELDLELFMNLKIAVMGCIVNGPGEAKTADYGITGGKGKGIVFKKGKVIKTVKESELIDTLVEIIKEDKRR